MNRDMQIAEAVRYAILVKGLEGDYLDAAMQSIIASVPAPEPYCWAVQGCSTPFYGEFAKLDAERESAYVGGTCKAFPLYTAPQPPAESVNKQLLDALAALGRGLEHTASNSPAELLPDVLRELGGRLLAMSVRGGSLTGAQELDKAIAAAEQQAQPEKCNNSDSWNCKYCRKTKDCKALNDPRNFATPDNGPVKQAQPAFFLVDDGVMHFYPGDQEGFASLHADREDCASVPLYTEPPATEVNQKLLLALKLAKEMFVANDLSLPHTFEVIDEAIAAAEKEIK